MVLLLNDDIEHIGVNPMFSHLSSEMGGLLFHWHSFLNNNNNITIYKAHNVRKKTESEAGAGC